MKFTLVLFVALSQYSNIISLLNPSTTAFALSGITLTLTPEFIEVTLGSVSSSLKFELKFPFNPPFSTFITGKSASGENVIGASFSIL